MTGTNFRRVRWFLSLVQSSAIETIFGTSAAIAKDITGSQKPLATLMAEETLSSPLVQLVTLQSFHFKRERKRKNEGERERMKERGRERERE